MTLLTRAPYVISQDALPVAEAGASAMQKTLDAVRANAARNTGQSFAPVSVDVIRTDKPDSWFKQPYPGDTSNYFSTNGEGLNRSRLWEIVRARYPWDECTGKTYEGQARIYRWLAMYFGITSLGPPRSGGGGGYDGGVSYRNPLVPVCQSEQYGEATTGDWRLGQLLTGVCSTDEFGNPRDFSNDRFYKQGMIGDFGHECLHALGVNAHVKRYWSKGETLTVIGGMYGWDQLNMMNVNSEYTAQTPVRLIDPRDGVEFELPAGMSPRQWCVNTHPDPEQRVSFNALLWYGSTGDASTAINPPRFCTLPTQVGEIIYIPANLEIDDDWDAIDCADFLRACEGFVEPMTTPPIPTPIPTPQPCNLTLNTTSITLKAGQRFNLKALSCSEDVTEPAFWRSLNPRVAKVSEDATAATDGLVTAQKPSRWSLTTETQIEAVYGGSTVRCLVNVRR